MKKTQLSSLSSSTCIAEISLGSVEMPQYMMTSRSRSRCMKKMFSIPGVLAFDRSSRLGASACVSIGVGMDRIHILLLPHSPQQPGRVVKRSLTEMQEEIEAHLEVKDLSALPPSNPLPRHHRLLLSWR